MVCKQKNLNAIVLNTSYINIFTTLKITSRFTNTSDASYVSRVIMGTSSVFRERRRMNAVGLLADSTASEVSNVALVYASRVPTYSCIFSIISSTPTNNSSGSFQCIRFFLDSNMESIPRIICRIDQSLSLSSTTFPWRYSLIVSCIK